MYIISNTKKLNSSTKKELQISAKLTAIGQIKKDTLWGKIEENFSYIINSKWNTKDLDYYLFFNYNLTNKKTTNIALQIVPIFDIKKLHDKDCDEMFAKSHIVDLKDDFFDFMLNIINEQSFDFKESALKEQIPFLISNLIDNVNSKAKSIEAACCESSLVFDVHRLIERELELRLPFHKISCNRNTEVINSDDYNNFTLKIEDTSEDNIPFVLEIPLYLTMTMQKPVGQYGDIYAFKKLDVLASTIYADIYAKKITLTKYKKNFYEKIRKEKEDEKIKKKESLTHNQLNTKDLLMFYKSNLDKLDFNNNFLGLVDEVINDSFDLNDESNIKLINELSSICSCINDYINFSKELVAIE